MLKSEYRFKLRFGSLYSEEEPDGQENRTDPDEEERSSAGGQYSRVRDAKTGRPAA
jgi:hypothetical protein